MFDTDSFIDMCICLFPDLVAWIPTRSDDYILAFQFWSFGILMGISIQKKTNLVLYKRKRLYFIIIIEKRTHT